MQHQIEKLKSNNKWIRLITLVTTAQALYIINQDPSLKPHADNVIDYIKEKCGELTTSLRTATSSNQTPSTDTKTEETKSDKKE